MLRVPGGRGTLLEAKARGADVRMVYSPLDALKIARQNPDQQVVFMAIGFETTAPSTAVTLLRARAEGLANFSVFCNHVTIEPPLRAILETPGIRIDAFVGPGHVSTVIGTDAYRVIPEEFGRPIVPHVRNEGEGLRCVYHGWKFDVTGRCVDMPIEPAGSTFKDKVRARAYPCAERGGLIWAYLGPRSTPPPLRSCSSAAPSRRPRWATRSSTSRSTSP